MSKDREWIVCDWCGGSGKAPCTACGGHGHHLTSKKICNGCNGTGKSFRHCIMCHGLQKVLKEEGD